MKVYDFYWNQKFSCVISQIYSIMINRYFVETLMNNRQLIEEHIKVYFDVERNKNVKLEKNEVQFKIFEWSESWGRWT